MDTTSQNFELRSQRRCRHETNRGCEYSPSKPKDGTGILLYSSTSSRVSKGGEWKKRSSFPTTMMVDHLPTPPQQQPYNFIPHPTYHYSSLSPELPQTPPLRRRNARDSHQPISPPNPLRLATTTNTIRVLPRPVTPALYFVQPPGFPLPTPLYPIHIGHPQMQIYKLRLPNHLIDGLSHIIDRSEQYVESLPKGWKTELYSLTKCDVACRDVPGLHEYVKPISKYICRAMKVLYGPCRDVKIDKNQPHVLKYTADMGYTGVELHHDRCDITANLALSRSDTYAGGGTTIAALGGQVIRLELGEFLLHPGSLVHGGNPITAGTRYLLITFANLKR